MFPSPLPESIDELARISLQLISGLSLPGELGEFRLEIAAAVRSDLDPALRRQRELEALKREPVRVLKPAWRRADASAADFIRRAKIVLRTPLGDRDNPVWAEAGFERGTLAVPESLAGRERLLGALRSFLVAHPDSQSPEVGFTVARADLLLEALGAARRGLQCHVARCKAARRTRDRAGSALRRRLRRTFVDLNTRLSEDSWFRPALGLDRDARMGGPFRSRETISDGVALAH